MTGVGQTRRDSAVVVVFIALSAVVVTAYRAAKRVALGQRDEHEDVATTCAFDARTLEIGSPTSAAWREEALARVGGLRFLEAWIRSQPDGSRPHGCGAVIDQHLKAA